MSLQLGRDGANRAVKAATGQSVSALSGLYVGLLDSLDYSAVAPGDLALGELTLAEVTTNEMSVTNFYIPNDRRSVTLGATVFVDEFGTYLTNTSTATWTNNTAVSQPVPGFFITDTQNYLNDNTGKILWIGAPSVGSQNFTAGEDITLSPGNLICRIA